MFLSIWKKASTAGPQSPGPFLVNLKIHSPLAVSTALWTSTVRSQVQACGTEGSFQKGSSPGPGEPPADRASLVLPSGYSRGLLPTQHLAMASVWCSGR